MLDNNGYLNIEALSVNPSGREQRDSTVYETVPPNMNNQTQLPPPEYDWSAGNANASSQPQQIW